MSAVMLRETRLSVRSPVQREPTPTVRAQTTVKGAKNVVGKAKSMLLFGRAFHNFRGSRVRAHCAKRNLVEKLITEVNT